MIKVCSYYDYKVNKIENCARSVVSTDPLQLSVTLILKLLISI